MVFYQVYSNDGPPGSKMTIEIHRKILKDQGLTNPLPGHSAQAPNWAGQVLFPARRRA